MDLLIIGQYFVNVLQLLNISVAAGNDGIGSRIYFVSRNDYGSWSEALKEVRIRNFKNQNFHAVCDNHEVIEFQTYDKARIDFGCLHDNYGVLF
jgi:hypothetical protein